MIVSDVLCRHLDLDVDDMYIYIDDCSRVERPLDSRNHFHLILVQ